MNDQTKSLKYAKKRISKLWMDRYKLINQVKKLEKQIELLTNKLENIDTPKSYVIAGRVVKKYRDGTEEIVPKCYIQKYDFSSLSSKTYGSQVIDKYMLSRYASGNITFEELFEK